MKIITVKVGDNLTAEMKKKNRPCIVNIHNPKNGKWKSYTLKHWFGKRISYEGKYGKITEQRLDKNMNFMHWFAIVNGERVIVFDPNYMLISIPN